MTTRQSPARLRHTVRGGLPGPALHRGSRDPGRGIAVDLGFSVSKLTDKTYIATCLSRGMLSLADLW